MNTTLITAHPLPDSFTRALAQRWAIGATSAGARVEHFDATELMFDPVLRQAHRARVADEPDLLRVREAMARSAHVTWVFPTWWAGLPAALKGLVDRLFLPKESFAYKNGLPRGLLAGRSTRWVTTMDSPAPWYWLYNRDSLQGSFGNGTLRFVGFGPIEKTMIYSERTLSPATREKWLTKMEKLGARDVMKRNARPALTATTAIST